MSFKPFKQLKVISQEDITPKVINDLQYNIGIALGQLLGKDTLDQTLVTNVTLLPGITNKVSHNLGRKLQGYLVVRSHGGYAMLQDLQDTNPSPHLLLYLLVPAQVTVDLLCF